MGKNDFLSPKAVRCNRFALVLTHPLPAPPFLPWKLGHALLLTNLAGRWACSTQIANRIKAKGLQKLRWYCQMCGKQCRDENGFKCHLSSDSHQRQMMVFGQVSYAVSVAAAGACIRRCCSSPRSSSEFHLVRCEVPAALPTACAQPSFNAAPL